jgi:hypothetical protein
LSISEPSKPLGQGSSTPDSINFDYLVELRRRHQTAQAARDVRTRVLDWGSEKAKESSIRQQLIKKLHLALKEKQDQATGTGRERSASNIPATTIPLVVVGLVSCTNLG